MMNIIKNKFAYICIIVVCFVLVFGFLNGDQVKGEEKVSENSMMDQNTVEHQSSMISDVPFINQKPELPRGCEVTSLAMLLQHAGVDVDKMELASNINKVPFEENGLRGNMNEGFVGDIYSFSNPGLGVYIQPLVDLGNQYLPNKLVDLTGSDIEELYRQIDNGRPVQVITNATFKQLPEDEFQLWDTSVGEMKVTYEEHSVVVTGYDENYVYINDPLANQENKRIDKQDFEEAWIQMGRQALVVEV
jgi:uncharacterized protein YvpB